MYKTKKLLLPLSLISISGCFLSIQSCAKAPEWEKTTYLTSYGGIRDYLQKNTQQINTTGYPWVQYDEHDGEITNKVYENIVLQNILNSSLQKCMDEYIAYGQGGYDNVIIKNKIVQKSDSVTLDLKVLAYDTPDTTNEPDNKWKLNGSFEMNSDKTIDLISLTETDTRIWGQNNPQTYNGENLDINIVPFDQEQDIKTPAFSFGTVEFKQPVYGGDFQNVYLCFAPFNPQEPPIELSGIGTYLINNCVKINNELAPNWSQQSLTDEVFLNKIKNNIKPKNLTNALVNSLTTSETTLTGASIKILLDSNNKYVVWQCKPQNDSIPESQIIIKFKKDNKIDCEYFVDNETARTTKTDLELTQAYKTAGGVNTLVYSNDAGEEQIFTLSTPDCANIVFLQQN